MVGDMVFPLLRKGVGMSQKDAEGVLDDAIGELVQEGIPEPL